MPAHLSPSLVTVCQIWLSSINFQIETLPPVLWGKCSRRVSASKLGPTAHADGAGALAHSVYPTAACARWAFRFLPMGMANSAAGFGLASSCDSCESIQLTWTEWACLRISSNSLRGNFSGRCVP